MHKTQRAQLIRLAAAGIIGLLLLLGIIALAGRSLRLSGITPTKVGTHTNVVLSFSQPLTNGPDIMKTLSLSPTTEVSVIVDKAGITIVPTDGFKPGKYTISVPRITAQQGSISNFTASFSVSASNPSSNDATAVDLDDIATRQYPKLAQIPENKASDYKLQYLYDGKKVIFLLYLIEPLDVDDSSANPYQGLINSDKAARTYIDALGVPKENYTIRYQSEVQGQLIKQYAPN